MNAEIEEIRPEKLSQLIEEDSVILVDVRDEDEIDGRHIPGSFPIPVSVFDPERVPNRLKKRPVFYCRSGRRSYEAALMWKDRFPDILPYNLRQGILGWLSQGHKVTRNF